MISYVLLLRGINVGGHRKILMAELKRALSGIGLVNVVSYIQSGNVVFQLENEVNTLVLEQEIADLIFEKFGHVVPVVVMPSKKFKSIVSANPFVENNNISDLHCTFLKVSVSQKDVNDFNELDFSPDCFLCTREAVYLLCVENYRNTKMTNTVLEKKLKTSCTTRNWKTTLKLVEMINQV